MAGAAQAGPRAARASQIAMAGGDRPGILRGWTPMRAEPEATDASRRNGIWRQNRLKALAMQKST